MRASKRTSLAVLVAAIGAVGMVLSVGAGDSSGPFFSLPENPMDGGRLFMEKGCVACHAVHGVGGTAGPDLGRVPAAWSFLGIAGVMWNHSPKMDAEFRRRRVWQTELRSMIYAFPTFHGAIGEAMGACGRGLATVLDPEYKGYEAHDAVGGTVES